MLSVSTTPNSPTSRHSSAPTGSEYARESMALFADPQVMQASMQALPAMMSGFGDIESDTRGDGGASGRTRL